MNPDAGPNLLQRSLGAAWLLATALTALYLPGDPKTGISILAGQSLTAANFFFLERLVKLFTRSTLSAGRDSKAPLPGTFFALAAVKLLVVYGGAFALIASRLVAPAGFAVGLGLPLLALFLKALMLALGAGPHSLLRRAPRTATTSGNVAKPAAFLLVALALSVVAPTLSFAEDPAPGATATVEQGTAPTVEQGATALEHGAATPSAEHGAATAAGHEAAGDEHGGGEQHLPNWLTILNDYFPSSAVVHWMHENEYLVFAWLAGVVFLGFTWLAMRRPQPVPGHLQNALEWIVESMEDVCGGMLGKHLPRYFPYIMAVFFYILTMNLIGIIPGFKSSTSTLDVTLALALVTFLFVQVSGIMNLGIFGYLDHLAGSPRDVVGFAMLPVMIPVHILGELVKPVSLSCRLFGNIFGEDTLIVVFVGVAALCLKASLVALAVPPMAGITALFMLLQTLTAIVQALIFSLLTTVYLYMMLPHEAHAHGEDAHAHAH